MQYDELTSVLFAEVPGFASSPELALVKDHVDLPGVVLAALTRYWLRLEQGGAKGSEAEALDAIYDVLERMATSDDPEVQNVLQVECFEHLDPSRSVTRQIVEKLGPNARALHATWN